MRAKCNLLLLPLIAGALAVMVWIDYQHEIAAVMDAHGIHASRITDHLTLAPLDEQTTPVAVARRALVLHLAAGLATLSLVMIAVNLILLRLVLAPLARVRQGIERMQRGQPLMAAEAGGSDEAGEVAVAFEQLGLTLDGLMRHIIRTERLATLALLSTTIAARIEPEVGRLGVTATRLQQLSDASAREAAHAVATAAARILATIRSLDRPFDENGGRR